MNLNQYFMRSTTKDDQVEILATALASGVLGAASARDFLLSGAFEERIFFLGVSGFVLFFGVAVISGFTPRLFNRSRKLISLLWLIFFSIGTGSAIDLFGHQFLTEQKPITVPAETVIFLSSYTLSLNFIYVINRDLLLTHLKQKTVYKYLLAPINGLSFGVLSGGGVVWLLA